MVEQNPKNRQNPEQYARLKAEIAAPYRGLRKFIYVACGASGFTGAFIFFFKVLAGKNIESALPNLLLQIGVVALMIFLWRWEERRQKR
jgi:Low psii accumulation1 / Rep27